MTYEDAVATYGMVTDSLPASTQLLVEVAEACEIRRDAIVMEVGLREGGGLLALMVGGKNVGSQNLHVAIDPYGDIPYQLGESANNWTYPNSMKNATIPRFHHFSEQQGMEFQFFNLEDSEFFVRFGNGIPVYKDAKKVLLTKYAIVHLDGPHNTPALSEQIKFLALRTISGSFIVIDDTNKPDWMNMEELGDLLNGYGFTLWKETVNRQAFIKT